MTYAEYEETRDFLVLHYNAVEREDTPFWRHCRAIRIPETLRAKWEMYKESANIVAVPGDLFRESSWFAVYTGQGCIPRTWHPFANIPSETNCAAAMDSSAPTCRNSCRPSRCTMTTLRSYCAAPPSD
jgi:tryptophan halogenase